MAAGKDQNVVAAYKDVVVRLVQCMLLHVPHNKVIKSEK